jgi:hypothetical protein
MYETLKKISFSPFRQMNLFKFINIFVFAEYKKKRRNERGEDERNDIFHFPHVRDVCVYAPRHNHICSWKLFRFLLPSRPPYLCGWVPLSL